MLESECAWITERIGETLYSLVTVVVWVAMFESTRSEHYKERAFDIYDTFFAPFVYCASLRGMNDVLTIYYNMVIKYYMYMYM